MGIFIGITSYLLLSLALALVAREFLQSYGIARKSGSRASLGAILFALFSFLSAGTALIIACKFLPAEYAALSKVAALGTFALFFYAAAAGIYLMRYMLPRTTLRVGILFLPIISSAFWVAFPNMLFSSPSHLHALVSKAGFILLASSLVSFLFVFSRFFFLSSNREVKFKTLKIMEGAALLLAGMFLSMVALPLLGISESFSALPAGFLGAAYIGMITLTAFSALSQSFRNKVAVNSSSTLADFLYSL